MTRHAAVSVLVLALAAGCARQPHPTTVPTSPPLPKPGLAALRSDLASYFSAPAFRNAVWGVEVRSLSSGDTLFALNPRTLLMPASNMKVVTAAVAADRLGWARTFDTRLVSAAPVENGVLAGDLVIVGAGDPSLGGRPGNASAVLDAWAGQLRARGITRIAGRVVGDDSAHDDEVLGQGWAWDYLAAGYATPAGALAFGENVVSLTLTPGATAGDPVGVGSQPAGHGLTIECAAATVAQDGETAIDIRRLPGSARVRITGTVPAGRAAVERVVSVDNPTLFTAGVVRAALVERGIEVDGGPVDIDALVPPPATDGAQVLASWTSSSVADILKVELKVSQNLYADTMFEAAGHAATGAPGSADTGRKTVQDTLTAWGIGPDGYVLADGSGLSRYNYLTASVLTAVLTRMYQDVMHRTPFVDALPVAGVDGSLSSRMKGTRATGNARAKTGSISNARALSGYVTTADGEPLVFSMIVNNFNVPQSEADTIVDRAVVRLAGFRRRP